MGKIKILIVDDSSFAREVIIDLLSKDSEIEIIGEAQNGLEAVEKVQALKPDLVTMDINMPIVNGLEAIEQIMAFNPVPILVVTSRGDVDTAYSAISKGALEVMPKPEVDPENAKEFTDKIKLLSKVKVISHILGKKYKLETTVNLKKRTKNGISTVVAIASSTGGPKALSKLLSELPEDFPAPIFIAQHIPQEFVAGMAEWLNDITRLNVKIGIFGEKIAAGNVYISPSEKHMSISPRKTIHLNLTSAGDIYFPSCDMLLSSVAGIYGKNSIGIILTGMGNDGINGIAAIKKAGGVTIAQDEATSVIFGMPGAAIKGGYIDKIMSIDKIGREICMEI